MPRPLLIRCACLVPYRANSVGMVGPKEVDGAASEVRIHFPSCRALTLVRTVVRYWGRHLCHCAAPVTPLFSSIFLASPSFLFSFLVPLRCGSPGIELRTEISQFTHRSVAATLSNFRFIARGPAGRGSFSQRVERAERSFGGGVGLLRHLLTNCAFYATQPARSSPACKGRK